MQENKFKVSINTNDGSTGEFMGGKEYFPNEDTAKLFFKQMVIDALDDSDNSEVFITDLDENKIISYFSNREDDFEKGD